MLARQHSGSTPALAVESRVMLIDSGSAIGGSLELEDRTTWVRIW
jgi:hypothetical protein